MYSANFDRFLNLHIIVETLLHNIIVETFDLSSSSPLLPPSFLLPKFTMMAVGMYKDIFDEMIAYLVDRIESNYALQIIPNSFLANPTTSPAFASILLQFLLTRMEKMGGGRGSGCGFTNWIINFFIVVVYCLQRRSRGQIYT